MMCNVLLLSLSLLANSKSIQIEKVDLWINMDSSVIFRRMGCNTLFLIVLYFAHLIVVLLLSSQVGTNFMSLYQSFYLG
jgi:hypothetical protein